MKRAENNVARLLRSRGIPYQAIEVPAEKLGAQEAAHLLHIPPARLFKTIVLRQHPPGRAVLALVPGDTVVDLRRVADALGAKKALMLTERQAEEATGLRAGGISPLALLEGAWRVLIDSSALDLEEIYLSGGQRGLILKIAPRDLATITRAEFAFIAGSAPGHDSEPAAAPSP